MNRHNHVHKVTVYLLVLSVKDTINFLITENYILSNEKIVKGVVALFSSYFNFKRFYF